MEISTRVRTYSHVFGKPEKKEKEQAAQKTIDIEHTPEVKDRINESNNQFDINDLSNPLTADSSKYDDHDENEMEFQGPTGEAPSEQTSEASGQDEKPDEKLVYRSSGFGTDEEIQDTDRIVPESGPSTVTAESVAGADKTSVLLKTDLKDETISAKSANNNIPDKAKSVQKSKAAKSIEKKKQKKAVR